MLRPTIDSTCWKLGAVPSPATSPVVPSTSTTVEVEAGDVVGRLRRRSPDHEQQRQRMHQPDEHRPQRTGTPGAPTPRGTPFRGR